MRDNLFFNVMRDMLFSKLGQSNCPTPFPFTVVTEAVKKSYFKLFCQINKKLKLYTGD